MSIFAPLVSPIRGRTNNVIPMNSRRMAHTTYVRYSSNNASSKVRGYNDNTSIRNHRKELPYNIRFRGADGLRNYNHQAQKIKTAPAYVNKFDSVEMDYSDL